jgi:REP element-mobilizing transposase RayT
LAQFKQVAPVKRSRTLEAGSIGAVLAQFNRVAPAKGSRTLEAGSIGAMMAQFKSITSKRINALRGTPGIPVWQRNYFEHIIRDEIEFGTICNYIQDNPLKWQDDQENPAL